MGDAILEGQVTWEGEKQYYASGSNLLRFPEGGYVQMAQLTDKTAKGVGHRSTSVTCNCTLVMVHFFRAIRYIKYLW